MINIIQKSIDRFRTATNIESVRRELENLEMATTYSIEICQIIVQTEWFMQVLINSFDHFNRSEPHKKLIGNILGIIINLLIRNDSIFLYNETVFEVMIRLLRNFPRSDFLLFRSLYILNLLLQNRQTFHVSFIIVMYAKNSEIIIFSILLVLQTKQTLDSDPGGYCEKECSKNSGV